MEWARRCIALGERKNYWFAVALGYEFLAEDSFGLGNWQDALDFAARDREIGEKIGANNRLAWAEFSRAWTFLGRGDLQDGVTAAQIGLELAQGSGDNRLAVAVEGILSMLKTDLGEEKAARTYAEHAVVGADELSQVFLQSVSRDAFAYWHLQREEWESAIKVYHQCAALLASTDNRVSPMLIWSHYAEACWGQGQFGEAARIIGEALALARDAQSRHYAAVATRVQGQILAAQELWDEAARAFDQAITTLEELGSRLELGRAFYHRGIMHQTGGDRASAHGDLTRALWLFDSAEARRDAEKAHKWLA
jgi:tetratricopeptide (TPR) repeat protein